MQSPLLTATERNLESEGARGGFHIREIERDVDHEVVARWVTSFLQRL